MTGGAMLVASDSRTGAVVDAIRAARGRRQPLRIRGAGTWLRAGRPVAAPATLSLADDHGVVEYVPGDLTLTARAGTTLAELDAAAREHAQWLPLEPWGGDAGTLGGTVSTATAGPYAHATGLPRDLVLGLELVSGAGQVIRAGGRVVKNVAGFDLTRLAVGSWGTLGVITEVTVRLRARPEASRTLLLSAPSGALGDLAATLHALPFIPLACELVNAPLAAHMDLPPRDSLVVRVGGNRRAVDAQRDALRHLGTLQDVGDDVILRLRGASSDAAASWRWSQLPSAFGATWQAAHDASRALAERSEVFVHGNVMRGVVHVIVPAHSAAGVSAADLARAASSFGGTMNVDAVPDDAWMHVGFRPAQDDISRRIRSTFDPDRILNPGIFGTDS